MISMNSLPAACSILDNLTAAVVAVQVVAEVAGAAEKGQANEEDQSVAAVTRDAAHRVPGAIVRVGIRIDANVLARAVVVFVVAVRIVSSSSSGAVKLGGGSHYKLRNYGSSGGGGGGGGGAGGENQPIAAAFDNKARVVNTFRV